MKEKAKDLIENDTTVSNFAKKIANIKILQGDRIRVLKIVSAISIAIYFLPINEYWDWLFSILRAEEPTAVSVPIFVFSLIFFVALISNLMEERLAYKIGVIVGAVNALLAINLILPMPYNTQVNSLGSYIILLINVIILVLSASYFLTS